MLQIPAFGETILFTFDRSIEEWVSYERPVRRVERPSVDGNGSLQVNVFLMGRGWSDNTFESPEINMDMSQYGGIRAQVFIASTAPGDIKGQIFVKSGPNFTWRDNGWMPLQRGQWTSLSIRSLKIEHIQNVKTIGIKVGSNNKWDGLAYIDKVEAMPTQIGQARASIKILQIVENSRIMGRVMGLDPAQYDQYKVVIYVKTDKWFIHPYDRGRGTFLREDQQRWLVEYRNGKRRFLADLVAALLVKMDYAPPPRVGDLRQINSLASYTEEGRGRL